MSVLAATGAAAVAPISHTPPAAAYACEQWGLGGVAGPAHPCALAGVRGPFPPPAARRPPQGYLDGAGKGINAAATWGLPGGCGKGISLADVEQGWIPDHENLAGARIRPILGDNHIHFAHGLCVLGVVAAQPGKGQGVHGIVPRLDAIYLSSLWRTARRIDLAEAIRAAAGRLRAGDVLLVEAQANGTDCPAELDRRVFKAIAGATRRGIAVVEAAGDGNCDVDQDLHGDSGAILVGAVHVPSMVRLGVSNFGRRIDCCAWGEKVFTTGAVNDVSLGSDPRESYCNGFNGTSAAAAIVAGAAAAVQGIAKRRLGHPFRSAALRQILRAEANGTLPAPASRGLVGVMPDLGKIIAHQRLASRPAKSH